MIQKSRAITLKDNLESSRRQLFSLRKKIVKEKVLLSDLGDALPVMGGLNTYTGNQYSNAAAETVFRRSKEEIKLMGKKFLDTYFYKQEYLSFERYLEQQVAVLHNDETSIACAGKKLWLHVITTNEVTHYGVDEKRCKAAITVATADRIGILPEFTGVRVHDGWKPYFQYRQCQHAFCNAHLLRELTCFAEGEKALWARNIAATLVVARQIVQEAQQKGEDALDPLMLYNLLSLYQADIKFAYEDISPPGPLSLLGEMTHQLVGKKLKKRSEQQKLLAHLDTYQSEILAFTRDFRIPFDNDLAEHGLRMMKDKLYFNSGYFLLPLY